MSLNKKAPRTAFPARTNAMGYQDGLTKLEWTAVQIYCAIAADNPQSTIDVAVIRAKLLLAECAKAEMAE